MSMTTDRILDAIVEWLDENHPYYRDEALGDIDLRSLAEHIAGKIR